MAKSFDVADMMSSEDYSTPAELFVSRRGLTKRGGLLYRRFETAAEAIDFAVEEYASLRPDDLTMTVGDKRFNLAAVRSFHGAATEALPQIAEAAE